MDNVNVVTIDEADERFGIRALFHLSDEDEDDRVIVLSGDHAVGTLPLDFADVRRWPAEQQDNGQVVGVVADGKLTVRDWIINWEWDFGPFLLARGNVRAQNVATAGSEVIVQGDLDVGQTLAGIYNHGRTIIAGDAKAQVVVTSQHVIEFHGGLSAEFAWADNFLRVADPAKVAVNGWVGLVHDLAGNLVPGLGHPKENRSLRVIGEDFRHFDIDEILGAMRTGRSLLRGPRPEAPPPGTPLAPGEEVRAVLMRAGCQENEVWDGGFMVVSRDGGWPVELSFCPCEGDEPDGMDAAVEFRRYVAALTAAGYQVQPDARDDDVLYVLPA
jgi:hypothetical protein